MPVREHPVQRLEVLGGGAGRLLGIGAFVDVPVLLQAVVAGRRPHELPHAAGTGARQRGRLEGAFDQRHVSEVERHALGAEDALDHREVLAASLQAAGQEFAQAALEQLHVVEDALVEGNRDVVRRLREIELHRLLDARARRRRRGERGDLEQLVDRGRFRRLLGEAVALLQRQGLVGGDPVDQTIEMASAAADPPSRRRARRAGCRATCRRRRVPARGARATARARQALKKRSASASRAAVGSTGADRSGEPGGRRRGGGGLNRRRDLRCRVAATCRRNQEDCNGQPERSSHLGAPLPDRAAPMCLRPAGGSYRG